MIDDILFTDLLFSTEFEAAPPGGTLLGIQFDGAVIAVEEVPEVLTVSTF